MLRIRQPHNTRGTVFGGQHEVPLSIYWKQCDLDEPDDVLNITFPPSPYGYQAIVDLKPCHSHVDAADRISPHAMIIRSFQSLAQPYCLANSRIQYVERHLLLLRDLYNRRLGLDPMSIHRLTSTYRPITLPAEFQRAYGTILFPHTPKYVHGGGCSNDDSAPSGEWKCSN